VRLINKGENMRVKLIKHDYGNEILLNNKYVGMGANRTVFIESIKVGGHKGSKLLGTTSTNKPFEIVGGIHAGGTKTDWWLEVNGIPVLYTDSAKDCLEHLCSIEWTDYRIEFTNKLYKEQN